MIIIVGLGNPGEKYKDTRHNVGFMVIEQLAQELSNCQIVKLSNLFKLQKRFNAEVCRVDNILLVKPQTFMNSSGVAVKKICHYNNLAIEQLNNLYIIYDDLDIKLGEFKIQFSKGPKLHNGLNSIEKHLKSNKFWRVRVGIESRILGYRDIGISREPVSIWNTSAGKDYVLQKFSKKEKIILEKTIKKVCDKLLSLINGA